jgi:CheY-like chemotaxis protein
MVDIDVANSIANVTARPTDIDQDGSDDHPVVEYSRLKFLVVDDSRFCRTLIKNALANYKINHVLEANDPAEAINILQTVAVDFVLVDYEMPGSDGVEFTRRIRWSEDDDLNPEIPIIMISQHTDKSIILAAREAGIHEFIGKPVAPIELFKRIRATIEHPRPFIIAETYRGPDRRWIER